MAFYESFYNVSLLVPAEDRPVLRSAMIELYFEGTEPDGLNEAQALAFSAVAGRIRKARQMSCAKSAQMSGHMSVPKSGQMSVRMSSETSVDWPETGGETQTDGDFGSDASERPTSENAVCEAKSGLMSVPKSGHMSGESMSVSYIDKEKEPKGSKEKDVAQTRFTPPTVDEVSEYVAAKGYHFDPETFVAHYESNGWMVGRSKMRRWKSACLTWEKNCQPGHGRQGARTAPQRQVSEHDVYSAL